MHSDFMSKNNTHSNTSYSHNHLQTQPWHAKGDVTGIICNAVLVRKVGTAYIRGVWGKVKLLDLILDRLPCLESHEMQNES